MTTDLQLWTTRAGRALAAAAVLAAGAARGAPLPRQLSVDDAIRLAWAHDDGLAAGAALARAAEADAAAARDARLPTLSLTARALATDEPMNAFGLKLDQQRITAADFAPDRLNAPDPVGGVGLGASLAVPLYAGGRIGAARRAGLAQAEAEVSAQARRRDEVAAAVVEAYFGAQVAAQGVRFADDQLRQAEETERFVRSRNAQGLLLDADVARATAFRAQAQAERSAAGQRLATARSALVLLAGDDAEGAELTTLVEAVAPAPAGAGAEAAGLSARPDLRAARSRAEAAGEATAMARAALLPEVMAQAGVETMRSAVDQGATWFAVGLVARWQLGLPAASSTRAAEARAAAAAAALRRQERQARREVDEARRAVEAADARVASAREAVSASESALALRRARHRQGLLPLTDELDAEAGLAGARTLLLRSQLEARIARAQLRLALGEPIEGVRS